jgi:hypothetical protein
LKYGKTGTTAVALWHAIMTAVEEAKRSIVETLQIVLYVLQVTAQAVPTILYPGITSKPNPTESTHT